MTAPLFHVIRPAVSGANAPKVKSPMLVLLHGVGSNEQSMVQIASAFDPPFVVVSVRSPITLGPHAYAWFHVTFTSIGPLIAAEEAAAGWQMLAEFIDDAAATYNADPARVYVAGFSQGGIMALAGLLTAPEKIAGAAVMSGRLLPEVLPHAAPAALLRDKPLLIVHGTADEKLGVQLARWAREQLAPFPLAMTYQEFSMGHTITAESLAVVTSWLSQCLDKTGASLT